MSVAGLSQELVFLILQFLDEEKYKETVHRLESESGLFCNIRYIEELITRGEWEELEKYMSGFIHFEDNRFSVKMLFEIRKQRYLEALDKPDRAMALEILNRDLKVFKQVNEDVFKEMTNLLTIGNIRENEHLSKYTDNRTARIVLIEELKRFIELNPKLKDKCQFPTVKNSRLRALINQSINWQHNLCRNPKPNPDIRTILADHVCGPSNSVVGPSHVPNPLVGSMLRPGGLQMPLQQQQKLQQQQQQQQQQQPDVSTFLATSLGQGTANQSSLTLHPNSGGVLVQAVHNTADHELLLKRSRPFAMSEEMNGIPLQIQNLPTSSVQRAGPSHGYNFLHSEDLPKNVIAVINQGSDVKSMDFHPEYRTLLLVGTNTGDVTIWELGSRMRLAHKSFSVWNTGGLSMTLQASLASEHPVIVNHVTWSPDGLLVGVAYSKHLVHIYSYRAGHELQDHLEIEAHVGNVSDLAFVIRLQKLHFITCGEDKTIKVWDAITGTIQHSFEGHEAPVYSICPHLKGGIQACDGFLFSSSIDGKIKTWLFGETSSRLDFDATGYTCTRMIYSPDGSRLFSCGSSKGQESFLVEWNDNDGTLKERYFGLGKQYAGVVHFDTSKKLLAAGDEFCVKFWDMNNQNLLFSTMADGGLPASPVIRFSKDGMLLAVTTTDHGVKVLGNAEGLRLVKSIESQAEARRVASETVFKAPTSASCVPPSSAVGNSTSIGFPERSITLQVMAPSRNQDNSQCLEVIRARNIGEPEQVWKTKEITNPSQLRTLKIPDNLLPVRVTRLMYVQTGNALLALAYNAVLKLWRWQKTDQNSTGNATTNEAPQLWQPSSGILMTNDVRDAVDMESIVPSLAISKNCSYVMSASGGRVSLFNMSTFKAMTSFIHPQPSATCLAFHPQDNNIIAVGLSDSSILIFNVRVDEILHTLSGHQKCVTGLAFCIVKKILFSSGADAQLIVWNIETWEKQSSKFLKLPSRRTSNPQAETRAHFNPDQTRVLVVHETQIAIYDPLTLDCIMQWVPRQSSGSISDAVYSCDGKSIYVCIEDGSVSVLTANHLRLKCRIGYSAYISSRPSGIRVSPNAIAAHPFDPNQVALGLSDGGVYVLEPLESDREWGSDPLAETGAGHSTNNVVAAAEL